MVNVNKTSSQIIENRTVKWGSALLVKTEQSLSQEPFVVIIHNS